MTRTANEPSVEPSALEAFMTTVANELGAAASTALAVIGDRLGLYRALAAAGPIGSSELAARTGCGERYVREWLYNQAAGGWVEYDADTEEFLLPAAHAAVVADESSSAFLGGSVQTVAALFRSLDALTTAFRTGDGIGWGDQHEDLHNGAARFFRTACRAALPGWIEALGAVPARLGAGGRVLDIGCGQGGAAIAVARMYPDAEVVGIDAHGPSVAKARAAAAAAGVVNRVSFVVDSADRYDGGQFDLVMMLDSLHDLGDPVAAVTTARRSLSDDGVLLLVEPLAGDRPEENFHAVGRMYYATSAAFCTPNALAQEGGWALGAQAGPARLRDVCARGGLTNVSAVAVTPFQLVLAARP